MDVQNSRDKFDEIKRLNRDYHASMAASLHLEAEDQENLRPSSKFLFLQVSIEKKC